MQERTYRLKIKSKLVTLKFKDTMQGDNMYLKGTVCLNGKKGYFPVINIDFERNLVTIYTPEGKETTPFSNVVSLNLNADNPIQVIPE